MLKLILPVLIPSWNFFDVIAPSPRVEYALLNDEGEATRNWQEFRPRPEKLGLMPMAQRLFWNARWNENLFVMSCAERLIAHPTRHSEDEIFKRIARDLKNRHMGGDANFMQFRLVFLHRDGQDITKSILFESPIRAVFREFSR